MGRRLYLCDWCEDHHFKEIPYPTQEPEPTDDTADHMHCQCWCVTG